MKTIVTPGITDVHGLHDYLVNNVSGFRHVYTGNNSESYAHPDNGFIRWHDGGDCIVNISDDVDSVAISSAINDSKSL